MRIKDYDETIEYISGLLFDSMKNKITIEDLKSIERRVENGDMLSNFSFQKIQDKIIRAINLNRILTYMFDFYTLEKYFEEVVAKNKTLLKGLTNNKRKLYFAIMGTRYQYDDTILFKAFDSVFLRYKTEFSVFDKLDDSEVTIFKEIIEKRLNMSGFVVGRRNRNKIINDLVDALFDEQDLVEYFSAVMSTLIDIDPEKELLTRNKVFYKIIGKSSTRKLDTKINRAFQTAYDSYFIPNYKFSNISPQITELDITNLKEFIDNARPLKDFETVNKTKDLTTKGFVSECIALLYSFEEIKTYFSRVIIPIFDDPDTWEYPEKETIFENITGTVHVSGINQRNVLTRAYDQFYDEILLPNYEFPSHFVDKTISCIQNRDTLVENHKLFDKYFFHRRKSSYIRYLARNVLPVVGRDEFQRYIDDLLNKHIEQILNAGSIKSTTIDFTDYVFGGEYPDDTYYKDTDDNSYQIAIFITNAIKKVDAGKKNKIFRNTPIMSSSVGQFESTKARNTRIDIMTMDECRVLELNQKYNLEDVYSAIDIIIEEYKHGSRRLPNYKDIIEDLKTKNQSNNKLIRKIRKNEDAYTLLKSHMNAKTKELAEYYYDHNDEAFLQSNGVAVIYYRHNEYYRSFTLDFSKLRDCQCKDEVRKYCRRVCKESHYKKTVISALLDVINAFSYILTKYDDIYFTDDIIEWHVLSYLSYLENEQQKKITTIDHIIVELRAFFRCSYESEEFGSSSWNPTSFTIPKVKSFGNTTPVIPEDILVFIDNHLNEIVRNDTKIAYRLLSETGWRFSDIRELKVKDISLEAGAQFACVRAKSTKTIDSRIKNNLGEFTEDVISLELYDEIQSYINQTSSIRAAYGIETLFFSVVRDMVSKYTADSLNAPLNELLQKHNIKSVDESYYRFSAMQTRKTVASVLISAGASSSDVQKKLGHVSSRATNQYYAEVSQKKISELNTEFFAKKFDVYLDKQKLKQFSEEERRLLYVDFCTSKRTVELGICTKHPSEGTCQSLGHKRCKTCPKLCTGKKYLASWEKMLKEDAALIVELESAYKKAGIPKEEYEKYKEYKQVKKEYEIDFEAVSKIRGVYGE